MGQMEANPGFPYLTPNNIMKKLITLTAGTLFAGSCLFGFKPTLQHAKSVVAGLRAEAEEALPSSHHLDLARQQLSSMESQIFDAESVLDEHSREEKRLDAELTRLRGLSEAARTRLTALRPALLSNSTFISGGCQYSQADVASDARELAAFIERCATGATAHEEALKRCRTVMQETRSALSETRHDYSGAKDRVAALALKLTQEEAIATVREATAATKGRVSGELNSDLARTMALLEKRASTLARRNATRTTTSDLPATRIPAAGAPDPTSLMQKVDAALGTPSSSAQTAAAGSKTI